MRRLPALACTLLSLAGMIGWAREAQALELFAPGEWRLQLIALLVAGAGVFATRRMQLSLGRAVGWVLACAGACWIWCLFALPWYERAWWWRLALPSGAISAWLLWVFAQSAARWVTLTRWLLVLLLTLPLLELALRAIDRAQPSALLARGRSQPGAALERNRPKPGTLRFRVPCNSQGHYDEEFAVRRTGEQRIAVIGDSFSQGSVPLAWHYTSVAERQLGIPVDNYGIAGIGVAEYAHLLRTEVLPRDPSVVVIALFAGNDLDVTPSEDHRSWEADWLDSSSVLVRLLPRRLARIAEERSRKQGLVAQVAGSADQRSGVDEQLYPWLADCALEIPTMSLEGFMRLERERERALAAWPASQAAELALQLDEMRRACGDRRFLVLLIPDELQVEDSLWNSVRTEGVERDRAQQLLCEALGSRGIEVLDLLPILRASAPLTDGRLHLYHLQDTHWNARGNAVAGRALAEFLKD